MAYTQQNLSDVESAIANLAAGARVQSVSYDGRTVTYHPANMADLLKLRDDMSRELARTTKKRVRMVRLVASSGF